jgi:hypothetical protein
MSDQPFYTPNRTIVPRQPRVGEHLWAIRKDGRQLDCELRDHGEWGVEVQVYREREFLYGRRFATRAGARGLRGQPTIDRRSLARCQHAVGAHGGLRGGFRISSSRGSNHPILCNGDLFRRHDAVDYERSELVLVEQQCRECQRERGRDWRRRRRRRDRRELSRRERQPARLHRRAVTAAFNVLAESDRHVDWERI